jgi:DNA-binding PadR family transcriptional regulator
VARRRMSNPLALAVLACLVERPMHPYEISTTLRSRGKEQSIKLNYGSLYSVVESLDKHGLIRARETTREGRRPERTVYEITDAGAIECEDWLAELISVPVREFTSLEAGLSLLPLLAPMEAARLLDDRAERLRIEQRVIDAGRAEAASIELPEIFTIESVYRRTMIAAELEFVTALARDIRSGAFKGTDWWQRIHDLRAEGIGFEQLAEDPVGLLGEEAARWINQPPRG